MMQKVPVPYIDSETLYNSIFSADNLHKKSARILENASNLSYSNRGYIFKRYAYYLEEAPYLERISISVGVSKEFSEILKYIYEYDTEFEEAKTIIHSNFRQKYDACPFCMLGTPDELDHYLSKAEFPEYTLFPPNLIPCCSKCNEIKGKRLRDEQGRREFFHFYFDEMPKKPILLFDYYYTNGRIKTRFIVDDSIKGDEYDLFRRQFKRLHIVERLNDLSHKKITVIFSLLRSTYELLGTKICFYQAERELHEYERNYGANYYITAIYRGILEDRTKFENMMQGDILF